MKHHGIQAPYGLQAFCQPGHQPHRSGHFQRLFPELTPSFQPADVLRRLGAQGGPMDSGTKNKTTKTVPAGQVIFGQFIDHDITLDVTSRLNRRNDAADVDNVRTPTLDLDCIYGSGPEAHPFLYEGDGDFAGVKLLTGADEPGAAGDPLLENDLLRVPNGQSNARGSAIIGDPRNDENRVISQMQLGMIRFHNYMVDKVNADRSAAGEAELHGGELFEEARRLTTWHYQWVVLHEFLPLMCGQALVQRILNCGREVYLPCGGEPFIPVEFSVAAYRFGHSMVPMKVQVRAGEGPQDFFGSVLGNGFSPVGSTSAIVDWNEQLVTPAKADFQPAERLDHLLASTLLDLPFVGEGPTSLATRNLERSNSFRLPAAEHVAELMGRDDEEIEKVMDKIKHLSDGDIIQGAPLWLYVLVEAGEIGRETKEDKFDPGEGLGPVGGRLVAEVLIGLLELDEHSFLAQNPNWLPEDSLDSLGKILTTVQPNPLP